MDKTSGNPNPAISRCAWPPAVPGVLPVLEEIHVWLGRMASVSGDHALLARILSADERERAGRFRFEGDRSRFIRRRSFLRSLLSRYEGVEPQELEFWVDREGKPCLRSRAGLTFNLSHSGDTVLVAIGLERPVGVDVERIDPNFDFEPVARRFFSEDEVRRLWSLSPGSRREAFFNCWARKEAYLKIIGKGLSLPLNSFSVSLAPGEPAALLDVRSEPGEVHRWTLRDLPPIAGFATSLAADRLVRQIRPRCWADEKIERKDGGKQVCSGDPGCA